MVAVVSVHMGGQVREGGGGRVNACVREGKRLHWW